MTSGLVTGHIFSEVKLQCTDRTIFKQCQFKNCTILPAGKLELAHCTGENIVIMGDSKSPIYKPITINGSTFNICDMTQVDRLDIHNSKVSFFNYAVGLYIWYIHRSYIDGNKIFIGGTRSDGYTFYGYEYEGKLRILAGCRNFNMKDAKRHWQWRKGTQLGDETFAILRTMTIMAGTRGIKV